MKELINRLKGKYKNININKEEEGLIIGREKREYYKKIFSIEEIGEIYIITIFIWKGVNQIDTVIKTVQNLNEIEEVIKTYYK